MYYLTIRQFMRSLKNLDTILGKAETYAEARKFDVNNFLTTRLYPDMLPFAVQVRIACDAAKLAGALLSAGRYPEFVSYGGRRLWVIACDHDDLDTTGV